MESLVTFFFFSSRRRHTRFKCDWSSDVCSSDLKNTLRNILSIETKAAHYAAALVIVVGCEALSTLLDKDEAHVFVDKLILPYGRLNRAMAEDVWDALRNGLAHSFDTKAIRVKNRRLELMVSWEDYQH